MLYKNFILAFRRIVIFRTQSVITVFGLGLSLLVVLVIGLIINDELQTDRFNLRYNDIYAVNLGDGMGLSCPAILATSIKDKISDIEQVARFNTFFGKFAILRNGDKPPLRSRIVFADKEIVNIFTFKPLYGNLPDALDQPYSLILTRSESKRLFGEENTVGKQLQFMDKYLLTVTAVIEDPPKNSIMRYTGIASLESLNAINSYTLTCGWNCWNVNTFLLLRHGSNPDSVASMITRELQPVLKAANIKVRLGNLRHIYFGSTHWVDFGESGNPFSDPDYRQGSLRNIGILSLVGALILLIALINYVNLATSKASVRAKETGLRKVIGASRRDLILQLMGESTLMSFLGLDLGIIGYNLLFPWLNNLMDLNLPPFYMNHGYQWLIFGGTTLLLGLLAGLYPAVTLTAFSLGEVIRKEMQSGRKGILLRKSLITGQFFISLVLIMATSVIFLQTRYVMTKDPGFNKENIITASFPFGFPFDLKLFREKLQEIPGVKEVHYSISYPGNAFDSWMVKVYYEGESKDRQYFAEQVEPGYLEMMGFKMVKGRYFSKDMATDRGCVIINETAARLFGLKDPFKARFPGFRDSAGFVIGVVKDFYFQSMHKEIGPFVFYCNDHEFATANIKLYPANQRSVTKTVSQIQKVWQSMYGSIPFDYSFLNQSLDSQYRSEQKYKLIFSLFSGIAIFIACLGLFGLATFTIDQRTKEIGIRKVNGASTLLIMQILSGEYILLLAVAFVLAVPLVLYSMVRWLHSFAYYMPFPWWVLPMAGLVVSLIALLTVSYQSWRVAQMNPVNSLRYE